MSQTTLRRIRAGSGVPLRQAAQRLGLNQAKLSNYETGKQRSPVNLFDRLVAAVAIGVPRPGDLPRFMVGYDVIGRRWLTDDQYRVVTFKSADAATAAAALLERDLFPAVRIVAAWPSGVELIVPDWRRRVEFDGSDADGEAIAQACSDRWLRIFHEAEAEMGRT